MTMWILAVLLLASLAGLGYRQGAIRVGFSFFGILLGAVLAVPLGRLLGRLLGLMGVKDPLLIWALGPLIVFVLISILVKAMAAVAHQKVDVHYKYHGGELRQILWERLNRRTGLCLGLLNATAYLTLLGFVIYVPSYVTFQFANSDQDPTWMRFLNRMGQDLHKTGFAKVARSLDSVPQTDYDMADFAALLYRNPLAVARLSSYPGFLGLGEAPEFQALGSDREFNDAWQKQAPIMALLAVPSVMTIRNTPELMKTTWNTVQSDLADVKAYMVSDHSAKYDPIKILGRWKLDVNSVAMAMRRAKPNMPASQMLKMRQFVEATFGKTTLVARPDNQLTLKNAPGLKLPATAAASNLQTIQGEWKEADGKYQVSISGQEAPATVEGDRLTIKGDGMDLVFTPLD